MDYVVENKFRTKEEDLQKSRILQLAEEIIKEHLKEGKAN